MSIDWKAILAQLVEAAVPVIIKAIPEIVSMILDWFRGMSDEEAVAVGRRAGMFYNAVRKEVA